MSLLSVRQLSCSLGGRQILQDISFDLAGGEFVGLIGPNGAGKSSLLRAAMGMIASTGSIHFDGQDGDSFTAVERARKAAYVAQSREVAWAITVEALVALGRTPHLARFAPMGATDRDAVEGAIRQTDIEALRDRPVTDLSGGELARVLVARALAQDTSLLLADEPTAGLDPAHQIALMRHFGNLAAQGRGIVVSTHDIGLAARFCTRLLILKGGRVVANDVPAKVLTPALLDEVYGVRAFFGEADQRLVLLPIDLSTPREPRI